MTEQVDSDEVRKSNKRLMRIVLLRSFLLFQSGGLLDMVVRSADVFGFLVDAMIQGIFLCIPWVILIAPLTFLLHFLYFRKRAKRICWPVIFTPSAVSWLVVAVGLVVYPPTVRGRFHLHGKAELPENVKNLKYEFTGGGGFLGDHIDDYYFQTTPDQVDRLIREMKFDVEEEKLSSADDYRYRLSGFPDVFTWKNPKKYRRYWDLSGFYRCLITDESRTQVYISLKSI
jgi:hypothetical protein